MKKFLNTLITTSILFSGLAVCAQTISAENVKALVANQIKTDLKNYNLDEVQVNVFNIPVESFNLPDGKVTVSVTSNSNGTNPKEYKKINIMVNKKPVRTIYVATEIKAFKNVVVAKEMISRDKAIAIQSVEMKKVDITRYLNDTLVIEDLSNGLIAKKVFYPAEIITKKYTVSRPDVIKNAMVSVSFKTDNNLTIMVEGIALTQGNIGDTIQVKNKSLNRVYTGVIVGENKVLIQI